jgi:hypothetical protein
MWRIIVLLCVIVMAPVGVIVSAQPLSLREVVKAHSRDLLIESRVEYPEAALEQIIQAADTILIGHVNGGLTHVSEAGTMLVTDYRITVGRVLRGVVAPDATIVVSRPGGATTIDEFNVVASDRDVPPFNGSERYILFLASSADPPGYILPCGAQSAFRIDGGSVRQASIVHGTWNETRGSVSIEAFVVEVQGIAAALDGSR